MSLSSCDTEIPNCGKGYIPLGTNCILATKNPVSGSSYTRYNRLDTDADISYDDKGRTADVSLFQCLDDCSKSGDCMGISYEYGDQIQTDPICNAIESISTSGVCRKINKIVKKPNFTTYQIPSDNGKCCISTYLKTQIGVDNFEITTPTSSVYLHPKITQNVDSNIKRYLTDYLGVECRKMMSGGTLTGEIATEYANWCKNSNLKVCDDFCKTNPDLCQKKFPVALVSSSVFVFLFLFISLFAYSKNNNRLLITSSILLVISLGISGYFGYLYLKFASDRFPIDDFESNYLDSTTGNCGDAIPPKNSGMNWNKASCTNSCKGYLKNCECQTMYLYGSTVGDIPCGDPPVGRLCSACRLLNLTRGEVSDQCVSNKVFTDSITCESNKSNSCFQDKTQK